MGNQPGRNLTKKNSQAKKQARDQEVATQTSHRKTPAQDGDTKTKKHVSKYQRKKILEAQGIHSKNSPYTVVHDTGNTTAPKKKPLTATTVNKRRPDKSQTTLLTKLFNNGHRVEKVYNIGGKTYIMPKPPEEHKTSPSLLMGKFNGTEWSLTKYFRAHSQAKIVAQKLPLEHLRNKSQIVDFLSKWQYAARTCFSSMPERGEVIRNLSPQSLIVGDRSNIVNARFS